MEYKSEILDLCVILILAAFAGNGVRRGLVMAVEKLAALAGGLIGAHLGAAALKGKVSSALILPWVMSRVESVTGDSYNPVNDFLNQMERLGGEAEGELMELMKEAGLPSFSFSAGWGRLLDRLTGTGTNILETAGNLVSERIAYVLLFILIFLVIQLVCLILFTNIEGLKNLPLMTTVNRIGGGLVGLGLGLCVVWLALMGGSLFFPSLTGAGGWLGSDVLEHTRVAGKIFLAAEQFLGG